MNEVRNVFSKKGFTLVELLAVIIILGIILILAVPRVTNMIDKYRDKAYEGQIDLIIKAAEIYSVLYEDEINWIGNEATITLKELQEKGLIVSPTKNPKGGEFDSESFTIILTRLANGSIDYAINVEGEGSHYTAQELQDMIDNQGYIEVATASDLNNVRGDLEGKYVQVANIDLSGYAEGEGWVPIGDNINNFKGTFDGNNYKITNLTINRPNSDYQGLFGVIYIPPHYPPMPGEPPRPIPEVLNIILINVDIKGNSYVGGLVGEGGNLITNCHLSGNVEGNSYVGGLVGEGGIYINNCHFSGSVEGNNLIGGLVGYHESSYYLILHCYSSGFVKGFGYHIGGLVGNSYGPITNCYSTSNVEGNQSVGGLLGYGPGPITNSYATGFVIGSYEVGGLVGVGGSVTNSYWDTETSGQSTSGGGTGKTTSEMKQQSTFAGWDFNTIWQIQEGVTYPYFR